VISHPYANGTDAAFTWACNLKPGDVARVSATKELVTFLSREWNGPTRRKHSIYVSTLLDRERRKYQAHDLEPQNVWERDETRKSITGSSGK
jgi:hypothetical protein